MGHILAIAGNICERKELVYSCIGKEVRVRTEPATDLPSHPATQGAPMAEQTVSSRTVDGVEYPAVGTYDIDVSHTRLGFAVRHMAVSKVRGEFKDFSGTLELAENPVDSKISVTIQAGSVDTHDENRDNHLRTNDFFDVENHPTWTFTSTAIRPPLGHRVGRRRRPHHPGRHQAGHPGRHARRASSGPLRHAPGGLQRHHVDRP